MSELSKTATGKFSNGFNCAQAVLSSFCKKYGISKEDAYRISTGLGGGLRCGEVCGAVTGAILVIGLKYGNTDLKDGNTKELCYQKTVEFTQLYKERKNTIVCRDLLGIDISTPENRQHAKQTGLFSTICPELIKLAVELLEELGY